MAKLRKFNKIENGVQETIKRLGKEKLESATGKSISFLRKCSDEDLNLSLIHI